MSATDMIETGPKVVSRDEWLAARKELLGREKALTTARDALSAARRALPWVKVEKTYVFDTPSGRKMLAELFDGRSQLIIKHFMLGPDWEEGCVGCSFEMDHVEAALQHIEQHDVRVVAVARAPLAKIEAFRKRMGWRFTWVSSADSDFNFDYHVSFTPEQMAAGEVVYNYRKDKAVSNELSGLSVFIRNEAGEVFHTYSAFGRGAEEVLGTYMLLDLTPKGRNENGPRFNLTDWVRHHDRYGAGGHVDHTGRYRAAAEEPVSACGCHPADNKTDDAA
jgi:predicted dithiol-disulfide oxidoreductase (DUF899 family)